MLLTLCDHIGNMADTKVVLESLLKSNASAIYSLLENVKHSQILQDKVGNSVIK